MHVRGRRARVVAIESFHDCRAVALDSPAGGQIILLTPFDRLQPLGEPPWRCASRLRAAAALASAFLAGRGLTRAARAAAAAPALQLPDWQLEALRAMQDGRATRVLIADAVGLGKTVQAGLVHLGLRADPARDRTLVVTPAGLRDQWKAEMERLFALRPLVIDAIGLRQLGSSLPPSVSPWAVPGMFIVAIDFLKQAEVLAAALDVRWSLVVLDEAHALTAHTDRRRAADLVARTADHVVLLTATPHSGDPSAFDELCRIGSHGEDRALVIRRDRRDLGLAVTRRTRLLRARAAPAERRLHARLRGYVRQVRREGLMTADGVQLAAWVLLKRAASSVRALRLTLERRWRALAGDPDEVAQASLPFGSERGETQDEDAWVPDAIDAPGLRDRRTELSVLQGLIDDAAAAEALDRKLALAVRFIRRARQPVIVFTEYRDTLQCLSEMLPPDRAAALHGGLRRIERLDALRAFTSGAVPVLLATDAAGEGLNLQHGCRVVVNVDVPWNPARLEQRIGRVDRLGQRRSVHALTLVSRAADSVFLRRLAVREERLRAGLAASTDVAMAEGPPDGSIASAVALIRAAARRRVPARPHVPWAALAPAARVRLGLPSGVLVAFQAEAAPGPAATPSACVAMLVELPADLLRRVKARQLIEGAIAAASRHAASHVRLSERQQDRPRGRGVDALRRRLAAALAAERSAREPCQPGLFDRRAITAALERRAIQVRRRERLEEALRRLDEPAAAEYVGAPRPVAALILR